MEWLLIPNSNTKARKSKQYKMSEIANTKQYDLEDRTLKFAKDCRQFVKSVQKTVGNIEDTKQLIRSSGSVGANYIEANESFSKKDFILRVKISRKEAKETRYWLQLIDINQDSNLDEKRLELIKESTELMNIFGAIIRKSE